MITMMVEVTFRITKKTEILCKIVFFRQFFVKKESEISRKKEFLALFFDDSFLQDPAESAYNDACKEEPNRYCERKKIEK